MTARTRLGTGFLVLLATALVAVPFQEAFALIVGGVGNNPIGDPGWPAGAAVIFNTESRIAWWEGPPLGGGQWHAECRGDTKALSAVLANFAKLDVKSKRVVLHDGVGRSRWLKGDAAKMDWCFMVWQPASWQGRDRNPDDEKDAESGPPAQLDVYTGGNVKWDDVKVPKGLKIVDQRLVAHGFTLADGLVLEGKVTDLATKKPLTARVMLERYEPKGKDEYVIVAEAATDADGRWVMKKTPAGWHRVVIEAAGYVPRVAGYINYDDQPRWHGLDGGLARPAPVAGRVTDDAGQPLADVEVHIADVATDAGRYESPLGYRVKTGNDGRFRAEQVPVGKAIIWIHKKGYSRLGLGQRITTPRNGVELKMTKSARVEVTVDFTGTERPQGYIVRIVPDDGEKVGSYGGSGNLDANNQITFEDVPPGRYTFTGRPNPGSADQQTDPVTHDLTGGKTAKVRLNAK